MHGIVSPVGRSAARGSDHQELLRVHQVARSFGDTHALRSCSFSVMEHEIHALLGENGSGKSTLVKILSGVITADAGRIDFLGDEFSPRTPATAQLLGVSTVFQETLTAEALSVLDNVLLGCDDVFRPKKWASRVSADRVRDLLDQFGLKHRRLDQPLWQLTLSERQIVTIVRAVLRPWRLLILDEATSALDIDQQERVIDFLTRRRDRPGAVLFISHRMDELQRVSDSITVLRSGESVKTLPTASATAESLVRLVSGVDTIAGKSQNGDKAPDSLPPSIVQSPVLVAKDVALASKAASFSLDVHKGEILGIAGLEGHGQVTFLEALVGLAPPAHGVVAVEASSLPSRYREVRSYRQAFSDGIIYVPRDRKTEGLFLPRSVKDNLTVTVLTRLTRLGIIRRKAVAELARSVIREVNIRIPHIDAPVTQLSGGNQQKVLLARAMNANPRVLVLNDPLRGVDQHTKLELYRFFQELSHRGIALVLLSTEVEELVILCERVAVFREHTLFDVLHDRDVTRDNVIGASFGQRFADA